MLAGTATSIKAISQHGCVRASAGTPPPRMPRWSSLRPAGGLACRAPAVPYLMVLRAALTCRRPLVYLCAAMFVCCWPR